MIRIDNLVKRVPTSEGELVILKGISLQIEAAETVAQVVGYVRARHTLDVSMPQQTRGER